MKSRSHGWMRALGVMVVALSSAACGPAGAGSAGSGTKARVSWVVDGDTITVRVGEVRERVRLIGVDSPETNDVREEYRQAAYDARDWLIGRLKGKTVILESDPDGEDRDRHDRLLRYVYLDGENVNLSLVREGWGWAYTRFRFSRSAEFRAAQEEARRRRGGVWSLPEGPRRKTK